MPVITPKRVVIAGYVPVAEAEILRERAEAADRTVSAEIRRAVRLYIGTALPEGTPERTTGLDGK